ncbi:AraC-like DNA-binding protein [Rhizobium sp. AG855]|nr:AraC-like DNA-binding protein [Rhizobium sp. AG855]
MGRSLQVYKTKSNTGVQFTCNERFDGYTLNRVQRGSLHSVSGKKKFVVAQNAPLLIHAREVDQNKVAPGAAFIGVALHTATLNQALTERLSGVAFTPLQFKNKYFPEPVAKGYESLCDLLISGTMRGGFLEANPMAVADIESAILNCILFGIENNYTAQLNSGHISAPNLVRDAIDYMHAQCMTPIGPSDVALAMGVSVRSLQLSFQKWLETTPSNYLRRVRLNKARDEIMSGELVRIGDVARKWGFLSPGEFSRIYLETFGELPKDTKKWKRFDYF